MCSQDRPIGSGTTYRSGLRCRSQPSVFVGRSVASGVFARSGVLVNYDRVKSPDRSCMQSVFGNKLLDRAIAGFDVETRFLKLGTNSF